MAYFGVQYQPTVPRPDLHKLDNMIMDNNGPAHWDRAKYRDEAGYETLLTVAYWTDVEIFENWKKTSGFDSWWTSDERLTESYGYFQEVFTPRVESMELTLFTAPWEPEGVANLATTISGEVREHSYWGGMHDRIPRTQTDWLKPEGIPKIIGLDPNGRRFRVTPAKNLCIIRSGQDWTKTIGDERNLYVDDIKPVLERGMDFLRDDGLGVGCYVMRMVRVLDDNGNEVEKSYGMGLFRSLDHLGTWAANHPTHSALYGTFMDVVQKLNFELDMTFYHEVAVLDEDEQFFEYLNCHSQTGMLRIGLG